MSVLSVTCCSLLSAVCAFTLVSAAGCGTDAQGVDDCRDIEEARCTAAKNCGIVTDVPACQRFYRDQCLHGLSVTSPGAAKVKDCVTTIRAAGVCAAQSGAGDTPLSDCDPVSRDASSAETACDLVKEPEKAAECAFLAPDADAGTSGSAGKGGSGGSAGTDDGAGAGGT